ncbi:MAG: hypothetical protein DMF78_14165 [Acidobacteria bacterium]|nr:MAG: hypothetical protein DMF78_14165 [Acidobacteriota bacterium]
MAERPPIDVPSSEAHIVRFGVFELDLRSGELRKGGRRGHLPDQPLQVLALLLEHPGELVTRDELHQRLWAADTYVDFERGLNAAVKRLRDALGDSADTPQFIETLHRRGYRFIAPIEPRASSVARTVELPSAREPLTYGRRLLTTVFGSAAVIALATGGYLLYRSGQSRLPTHARPLSRLTFDPGLQTQPTWSPDGRFIAYISDRSGNFDIWVRPVAGGDAVQVTHDPAHDWQPDWSPDGSQIVFRSERGGGGLYVVPPLGGHERKLTDFGYSPRWSPDGTRIAFAGNDFYRSSERLTMYLARLDGSAPRQILGDFLARFTMRPAFAWHPDGERLSFYGWRSGFWTVPVEGGPAVRSGREPDVQRAWSETPVVISNDAFARLAWAPSGRMVFFTGYSKQVQNIWKVDVDPQTLRWVGGLERLTTGLGDDMELALSRDGRSVAFVSLPASNLRLWAYPFNASNGHVEGEGQPVTPQESYSWAPDLTHDGRKLVFFTRHPGRPERNFLTERRLSDSSERLLALDNPEDGEGRGLPVHWSPDGTRLVYKYLHKPSTSWLQTMNVATGQEQPITSPYKLTERWGVEGRYENASDWSADGKWIVATGERYADGRGSIALLPLSGAPQAERQARIVTSDTCHSLYEAVISPDDRWIAFQALSASDERISTLYAVARSGGTWIQLTEGRYWDSDPHWSPDGSIVYFISSRGGDLNVWGIRFDSSEGTLRSDPFHVTSFQGPRHRIVPFSHHTIDFAVDRQRLVLVMHDLTGGIWVLDNVDR